MIRQIRRLTRALPAAGRQALAISVYGEAIGAGFTLRAADEHGLEGVACLDDAARAARLYCDLWRRYRFEWARQAAIGFLEFVTYMQDEDGRFCNFVLDWRGQRNRTSPTSRPGGQPWLVRAMQALARGIATFQTAELADRFELGLRWLDQPIPFLDLRASAALAVLEHWSVTGDRRSRDRARAWCGEIAASCVEGVLPDVPKRAQVHLWGHCQEAALALGGMLLGEQNWVRTAERSARLVFWPRVGSAFAGTSIPYDVSSTVFALGAVADAADSGAMRRQADLAVLWFDGRNAAVHPMYDRARGLVYDGIDGDRVNPNSGAESNIEGGLALIDSLPWAEFGPLLPSRPGGSPPPRGVRDLPGRPPEDPLVERNVVVYHPVRREALLDVGAAAPSVELVDLGDS